ncbi:alpha/beta fold hydrolase [Solicola gregarius]|uniref:Alpha/beta hydrolase n=1 Tax=Solicola gregarius TaxID=2908642 RepID=A0AA46YMK4_9ACTN|nr:alpha/beta hydrolase [Solicola gregarius]UYM05833.1 alpha/beta hydrolase [Solicola gregarius]
MTAQTVAAPTAVPRVRFYDVYSADGTRLRAWSNDAEGPTVLLCNGLGTNPYAWPALLSPGCGVRVISWNHRGVGGSERPADRDRISMDDFVDDAIAVLDDAGVDSCVVMGWSMGVNVSFELATLHPERVEGLLAVAGVPGDTFSTMLGPFHVPAPVARTLTVGSAWAMLATGKALSVVTKRLPWNPVTTRLLRHSGFMLPAASDAVVREAVREFLTTDIDWYMRLAVHAARHPRVSLSHIEVPTTFVSGHWDVLAGARSMGTAAERMADARVVELRGSHFLPMEYPDEIHAELLGLLARTSHTSIE